MSAFLKEFKQFAMRGNVMDMAVGVIIGGAFGKIVSSVIGVITGGVDFSNLSFKVEDAEVKYGMFLQNVIDFLIVASCIFVMIKAVNKLAKHKEETPAPAAPAEPTPTEKLLAEIRDELRKESK